LTSNLVPAILVCHGPRSRKWFVRASDVPERWFPQEQLDARSHAMDVLYDKGGQHSPQLVNAGVWFDRYDASRYRLYEQSIKLVEGEGLTLLVPKDAEMLEDEEDRNGLWRRR